MFETISESTLYPGVRCIRDVMFKGPLLGSMLYPRIYPKVRYIRGYDISECTLLHTRVRNSRGTYGLAVYGFSIVFLAKSGLLASPAARLPTGHNGQLQVDKSKSELHVWSYTLPRDRGIAVGARGLGRGAGWQGADGPAGRGKVVRGRWARRQGVGQGMHGLQRFV